MSHVVPHVKNYHCDDSPLVPKGTCCSATSNADNTRFGLSPILGESEGCSEKRARSLHRQHSRRGRMMKKWKQRFWGSSVATTMVWNDARVSSSTPQRMQSNCGLVVNAALQFALHSAGVASKLCEPPSHDGAVFFHCGEGVAIADNVLNTAGELVPDRVRVTTKIFGYPTSRRSRLPSLRRRQSDYRQFGEPLWSTGS